jgi:acetyl esterase/lipase
MDDTSYLVLFKILFPKLPLLLKAATAHTLSLTETSSKWNLRTELTIRFIRALIAGDPKRPSLSIAKQQRGTLKDPGIKGELWVSKCRFKAPDEDDLRVMLFDAIDALMMRNENGESDVKGSYHHCLAQPLEAEWVGYRSGVKADTPEPPGLSEAEKYQNIQNEIRTPLTLLYLHGGAFYLLDPAFYRPMASQMAKMTGGRVFNVRYRLAPQNPFPAALLDALTAYLTLLYPPPGAQHEAVPPEEIVVAGDSAGGNLSTALLALLCHLHRSSPNHTPTVVFHGRQVSVPLPAGVALISPWLDQTRSLDSWTSNAEFDFLPPPTERAPGLGDYNVAPCGIWPANPPRETMYCNGDMLTHPLVSPVLADLTTADGKIGSPMLVLSGQECLQDDAYVIVQRLARLNGAVRLEWFEAMPHCFGLMFPHLAEGKRFFKGLAEWCVDTVQKGRFMKDLGKSVGKDGSTSSEGINAERTVVERETAQATISDDTTEDPKLEDTKRVSGEEGKGWGRTAVVQIAAKTLRETEIDPQNLINLSDEQVRVKMESMQRRIMDAFRRSNRARNAVPML